MENTLKSMDKIVALCRTRGIVFPGSEIYGGLANTWDYGPLGVEMKNNIKRAWWKKFIQESPYNVGLDSAILMNPQTWVASGHTRSFSDPLMDCKVCKSRFRADKLIEETPGHQHAASLVNAGDVQALESYIKQHKIRCPKCGAHDFTEVRQFNLMFRTHQGVTEDSRALVYLRPETAQGIFVNFKNVLRTSRRKLPMGIGQTGKSFRNEITPGNFIFRTREFEQMELEFFCKPGEDMHWFSYWRDFCEQWLYGLGLRAESVRIREHDKEELSHYSVATSDIEFLFPFGWGELWGIANRTDYDLRQHAEHSGEDMSYQDPATMEKYLPYCIEPAVGVERLLLAFLTDAYEEERIAENDTRTVLRLHHALSAVKVAVLPLSKKLTETSLLLYQDLSKHFVTEYDESGSIGRRYRRQDEIGTPYCVTVDFDSLTDNAVTVRHRDTMEQVRVGISSLRAYLTDNLEY